ncbi:Lrp/AsnC family transcriptional regulator [Pandoraea anhela]|uniref:ArsR family transcriptional regulator n=1 Tax=Pandoraea anhela TaxID=2508295 RepID=A0A5E4YS07_9BURK|nr:Lrp/AsnC family transcriptional regulator [Pandoraea anhela]VVE51589.1 ArsR family transcriptional regulator [Pandoraea anhela]
MDSIDKRIIEILQENAETPIQTIAERVNLSTTPCWRRVQKLKDTGVIRRQVVLCDAKHLNVGITVFITIRTAQHSPAWLNKFVKHVGDIPEVIEFYRMTGRIDYMLRVVVPNIESYDRVYKRLIDIADLYDVSSSFAMEQLKYTTALPVDYA